MSQATNALAGFFSGGGRAAKFPEIGTTVSGTIVAVHEPEPQTDFETKLPIPGKTQVRIELATAERDPEDPDDDGKRTIYVRGWMKGSIGDALRKAGVSEPKPGATLAITYTRDGQPTRPGLRGPKQFVAVYTPATASTASYFAPAVSAPYFGTGAPAAAHAPFHATPPPGIDPGAWAAMPEAAKQAIAGAQTFLDTPPF